MSTNVTEADSYAEDIPTPVLGDKFSYPATVTDALTKLASRAKWLRATLAGSTGSTTTLTNSNTSISDPAAIVVPDPTRSSVIYTLAFSLIGKIRFIRQSVWGQTEIAGSAMSVPVLPVMEWDGSSPTYEPPGTDWKPTASMGDSLRWYQVNTPTDPPALWWYIHGLPPAGKITSFSCRLQGGSGHAGIPSVMPVLSLYKRVTGSAPVLIASVTDPTATAGPYEVEHAVFSAEFVESLGPDTAYFFRLDGEAGTNKENALQISTCTVTIGPPS